MKRIITTSLLAALLCASGCISILERTEKDYRITHVYQPTCTCAESIALPFKEKKHGEDGIAQAICTILLPCTIIDLPFDAVVDTVCLPWDIYRTCQNSKQEPLSPNDDAEIIEEIN